MEKEEINSDTLNFVGSNQYKIWVWIIIIIIIGIIIALLLYNYYKGYCNTNKDCTHLCKSNDPNCTTTCNNKRCKVYNCKDGNCPIIPITDISTNKMRTMSKPMNSHEMMNGYEMDDYEFHKYMNYMGNNNIDNNMYKENTKYFKNYSKYLKCMKDIFEGCKLSTPDKEGKSYGKMNGKKYMQDMLGNIQMKDSQNNWWIKGSSDKWWFEDKEHNIMKKNNKGTMWKKDHAGNIWKKYKGDSNWKITKNAMMDMDQDINLSKKHNITMYSNIPINKYNMMDRANFYDKYKTMQVPTEPLNISYPTNNYGFDYNPTCGYASRVNMYGQPYALDEPLNINNGMVPQNILQTKSQYGVASNISEYGMDPELLGHDTTNKDYYSVSY